MVLFFGALLKQTAHRRKKLRQMQEYAEPSGCRREILLRYFGEDFTPPCNNCDNREPANVDRVEGGTRREVAW